jgi:hypothetical protein
MRLKGASVLLLVAGGLCWSQFNPYGQTGRQRSGLGDNPADSDPAFVQRRIRALNADRQKSMVADTEKLVNLARQLDAEIASNPTGEPTADELQKIAAIEKLAKNVKTKMAQSFGEGPSLKSPIAPIGEAGVR